MTARALWLWLHEAVEPIPHTEAKVMVFAPDRNHTMWRGLEGHDDCFDMFVERLVDSRPIFPPSAPPIVHDMERRAREAWNGEVG